MNIVHLNSAAKTADKGSILLLDPHEYLACRAAIQQAILKGEDVQVHVSCPVCSKWFWDLALDHRFTVRAADSLAQLKKKLGVHSLPAELEKHPEYVDELGLLDQPNPEGAVDVEEWIAEQLLGAVWCVRQPSFDHLEQLVAWQLANLDEADRPHRYLRSIAASRQATWLDIADGQTKIAYNSYFEDPRKFSCTLSALYNLSVYPDDLLHNWLSQAKLLLESALWVSGKLRELPIPDYVVKKLGSRIRQHWNGRMQSGAADPQRFLSGMSGRLEPELACLTGFLRSHPQLCTKPLLASIRAKFSELPGAGETINALEPCVRPEIPPEPSADWSCQEWLDWVAKDYIPYRSWALDYQPDDSTVSTLSSAYENWLYSAYPSLLNKADPLVMSTCQHVRKLVAEGDLVLWVLVDNLSLLWADRLLQELCKEGLHLSCPQALQLSMLPSETSCSRSSALLGATPVDLQGVKDSNAEFVERWNARGVKARWLENLDIDRHSDVLDADLLLYIYPGLDQWAHTPDHELDNRREEHLLMRTRTLAASVARAMVALGEVKRTRLIISSDHGSTRLDGVHRVKVPASAAETEDYKRHRRFVQVTQLSSLNDVEWFRLDAGQFGLVHDVGVARGFRYIDQKPKGFTHGGLLPEETVVPLLVLESGAVPTENLLSFEQISEPIIRGKPQELQLAVSNELDLPVTDLEVTVPDCGGHWKLEELPKMTKTSLGVSSVTLPARLPSEAGLSTVRLTADFRVAGARRSQVAELAVRIRELYTSEASDIGDMFDEHR